MTDTSRRDELRQQLQNETARPRPIAALSASFDALARQRRTPADDAAASVCQTLWTADRRTLQLLPPDVCAALNRWHDAQQAQTAEAEPSAPKPRM